MQGKSRTTYLDEGDLILGDVVNQFDDLGVVCPVLRIKWNPDALRQIRRQKVVAVSLEQRELAPCFTQRSQLQSAVMSQIRYFNHRDPFDATHRAVYLDPILLCDRRVENIV